MSTLESPQEEHARLRVMEKQDGNNRRALGHRMCSKVPMADWGPRMGVLGEGCRAHLARGPSKSSETGTNVSQRTLGTQAETKVQTHVRDTHVH